MAQPGNYGPGSYDVKVKGEAENTFDSTDQSIRKRYIRKVYMILITQFLITMSFIVFFFFHGPTQQFIWQNDFLFWIAFAMVLVCIIVMVYYTEVCRKARMNFIFLAIFTIAQSLLLGIGTTVYLYSLEQIIITAIITAVICLGAAFFVFQTKWDFTTRGGAMVAYSIVLLVFGILPITLRGELLLLAYIAAGVFIFSFYLVYDKELMMGASTSRAYLPKNIYSEL